MAREAIPVASRAAMSLTVVGSLAFDAVKTPSGSRDRMLGGAATHFALAASFFDEVRPVGPVGDDFGADELAILRTRGTVTDDVEHVAGGKTFFWAGEYHDNLNTRTTLRTDLNVFEHFEPKLSDAAQDCDVLFLANIQPDLQFHVREQCQKARFVAMDSMNLWIDIARESLVRTVKAVDCLILNDEELEQLTGAPTTVKAAEELLGWGLKASRSRPIRWPTSSTPPARATRSPAASWATSPRSPTSRWATSCSPRRWPTAPRWPPSTSRSSAPSASRG